MMMMMMTADTFRKYHHYYELIPGAAVQGGQVMMMTMLLLLLLLIRSHVYRYRGDRGRRYANQQAGKAPEAIRSKHLATYFLFFSVFLSPRSRHRCRDGGSRGAFPGGNPRATS